jgi:hypothetical protein
MKLTFASLRSLVIVCITLGSALNAAPERYFQVEMLAPGHFRIQPNNPGPISTVLVGGGQSQLITIQENGRTSIYAEVQPGASLKIKVGSHQLHLWMIDSNNYETREE